MVDVPVRVREREWEGEMDLFDRVRDRAYELFRDRGGEPGHEHEDWLRAEREVFSGADSDVVETGRGYRLRCRLPGFAAEEIRVRAGGREIVVEAERQGEPVGLEMRNAYRRMNVGEPIDAGRVSAEWDGCTLVVEAVRASQASGNGELADSQVTAAGATA